MPVFNVRDFGARGDGSGDDTQAIVNAVSYLASQPNSFQNSLYLPAGRYLTSDGVAGYMNVQYLQLPSGSSGSFGVGVGGQYTGISITWSATDTAANATALQNALAAVGLVGTGNVTVTYDPVTTWYKIIFAVWLGGPYPSPDALVQPPPTLTPIFFRGNPNQQAIQITSASNGSFTLTVTVGTAAGMSTLTTSPAVNYLTGSGNTAANASAIQTALGGLTNVGSRNVACTYDSVKGYIVTFAPSLGAVVMTASSGNLTVSLTTFQSGAAIVIPNLFGLRIFGDGGALADYDQPAALVASSRSALVWNGTANGILLHLLGCNNTTIENLSIWGGTSQSSANQARTGLLLSASLANAAGQQGGSGLSCKTCVFTRFLSRPPTGTTFPPQAIGGCVQLGLNQTDPGADVTNYQATTFAHGTNGLVAVNQSSVNHYLSGCVISDLTTALWMQLGGGLSADGLKAESPGQSPMTVLQIGAGSSPYAYYGYGGGGNANTFLMRNVRTDLLSPSGYNITLVDATYASPGTQVTVDGWDDSQSNPVGPPIMFAQSMSGTSATSSVSVTLSVTAGDTLVAFGGAATTTNPSTTAVTDTNGNTWVFVTGSAVHSATTPAASGGAWYCKNANAGSTMITFAAPGTNCALTVHEYRNVDTVATLEASAAAGSTSTSTNAPNSGNFSTATAHYGDALVAWTAQSSGTITYTAAAGFTLREKNAGSGTVISYASEDQIGVAPGTYNGSFSQSAASQWVCICLALKAATELTPAVLLGSGASANLRHSLANRGALAQESTANAPSQTYPAALRLENLIVPESFLAASLCQSLTANTKVDVVTERTNQYNVLRPDVNTIAGRARYAPVTWLIQQLKPKFFYDLGDVGLIAPNQGTNLYINTSVTRSDGQYVSPGSITQNAQGIVRSDSVGGFNTRGPSGTPSGWVKLLNGGMNIGPVSGKDWTLLVIINRNSNSTLSGKQWIFTNVASSSPSGGFALYIDDANSSEVTFYTYNGTNPNATVTGTSNNGSTGAPLYIMIQVTSTNTVTIYTQGSLTAERTVAGYGSTTDSTTVPLIGVPQGPASPIADLGIARFATFDSLVPTSAWNKIYTTGSSLSSR